MLERLETANPQSLVKLSTTVLPFAISEDPNEMPHFIMVCTVCLDKIDRFIFFLNHNPSIYTMDHPDFIVCFCLI